MVGERADRVIEQTLKRAGLWDNAMRHMATQVWAEVVGERISSHAHAAGVLGTTLVVRVENPSWRHQLHLMRLDLLNRLNNRLGGRYIDEVRFTTRKALIAEQCEPQHGARRWPGPGSLREVALAPREVREIEQSAASVTDPRLRGACRKFVLTMIRRKHLLEDLGLKQCRICGTMAIGSICDQCTSEMALARQRRAVDILSRLPWLDEEGLRGVDPELGSGEYRVAQETLKSLWLKESSLIASGRSKKAAMRLRLHLANLSMLLTHTPPEKLTDGVICSVVPSRFAELAGLKKKEAK